MTRDPFSRDSLTVQGSNDVETPREIHDFYEERKGVSIDFLRKHYGFGKSMHIAPRKEDLDARMLSRF